MLIICIIKMEMQVQEENDEILRRKWTFQTLRVKGNSILLNRKKKLILNFSGLKVLTLSSSTPMSSPKNLATNANTGRKEKAMKKAESK